MIPPGWTPIYKPGLGIHTQTLLTHFEIARNPNVFTRYLQKICSTMTCPEIEKTSHENLEQHMIATLEIISLSWCQGLE